MSLPYETQVLIVGAGPTGLACAITLAKLGVDVVIVDSSSTNPNGSRAAVVHAHTLEILDTIGVANPLIDRGTKAEGVTIRGGTNTLLEYNLSQLRDVTQYPFALMIPQDEVERIFRDILASEGVQVLMNKTVVGMRRGDDCSAAVVTFEDGSNIKTQYVVGADGSRSVVRRLSGIEFKDPRTGVPYDSKSIPPSFNIVLADAYLENVPESIPRNRPSIHLDKFFLIIPLRSHHDLEDKPSIFWRIGYGISTDQPRPPRQPSIEYLQQQMDERNPWKTKMTISSVSTSSSYKVRSAVASTYFQKLGDSNVLLAGDAAHVHSPAGGQGMNLGICDAVAVARAILSHMTAKDVETRDVILERYADSRRKIGVRVISMTGGLTNFMNAESFWRRLVRNLVFGLIAHLPFVSRLIAWRVSGLVNRDG